MNKIISFFTAPKHLSLAVAGFSALALAGAYISQYGFGLDPCALCFYQRKPYFVNIALGVLAFALANKNKKAALAVLFLSALAFLIDAGIAGFHVGVEQKWWKGLEACANMALPENATIDELRAFIKSRDIVRCDVPAFVFLGISMAGYNFFYALGLAIFTFYFALRLTRSTNHGTHN